MESVDSTDSTSPPAGKPGWKRSRLLLVVAVAVVLLGAVGIGAMRLSESKAENGNELAARLGLPANHRCGTATTSFTPSAGASDIEIFALESTWHWVAQCLGAILAEAKEGKSRAASVDEFLHAQVLYVLSRPPVRFYRSGDDTRHPAADVLGEDGRPNPSSFDRLVYTNQHGVAHNAMSQGALGGWFIEAAQYYSRRGDRPDLAADYGVLGDAALAVILDDVDDGGLRSRSECSRKPGHYCSWFHAVTAQSRPSPRAGGTLNKHLLVILDLHGAARAIRRTRTDEPEAARRERADALEAAAVEGLYQLAYAEGHRGTGSAPNLFDYIAIDESGAPIADSWLFYGLNPQKDVGGYYLKVRAYKNCHYHILDMRLLRRIFESVGKGADLSGFTQSDPFLGRSLVGFLVDAYDRKLATGLFAESPDSPGERFVGCRPDLFDPAGFEEVRDYFHAMDTTS